MQTRRNAETDQCLRKSEDIAAAGIDRPGTIDHLNCKSTAYTSDHFHCNQRVRCAGLHSKAHGQQRTVQCRNLCSHGSRLLLQFVLPEGKMARDERAERDPVPRWTMQRATVMATKRCQQAGACVSEYLRCSGAQVLHHSVILNCRWIKNTFLRCDFACDQICAVTTIM